MFSAFPLKSQIEPFHPKVCPFVLDKDECVVIGYFTLLSYYCILKLEEYVVKYWKILEPEPAARSTQGYCWFCVGIPAELSNKFLYKCI